MNSDELFFAKKREVKLLKNDKGLPNFELVGNVFWDNGAQGIFARSTKEAPLTDAEEREVARSPSKSIPNVISYSNSTNEMDESILVMSTDIPFSNSKRKSVSTSDCEMSEKKM